LSELGSVAVAIAEWRATLDARVKAGVNLKVGASGDTTTRASITWTTATRMLPNGRGPLIVGYAPPAGKALERLHRAAELNSRRVGDLLQQQRQEPTT
jgi:hypothetical protein